LVMTALYSINLRVMGRSNIPLLSNRTLGSMVSDFGTAVFGSERINLLGWMVSPADLALLLAALIAAAVAAVIVLWFFRTEVGTAMRATGDNAQMVRALGANVELYRIFGLA